MKSKDSDKTFRVFYYFNALEFSNDPYLNTSNIMSIDGASVSFDCNYVLLTKKGLHVNKNTSYIKTHISSLCIIISEDLNLKELNRGYRFINKYFKFQKLYVTTKQYLDEDFAFHMRTPLKLEMKEYDNKEFQNILVNLQSLKD